MAILLPFCNGFMGHKDADGKDCSGLDIVRKMWNEDKMMMPDDGFIYRVISWLCKCCPSTMFRVYSICIFLTNFLEPFVDSILGKIKSV